MIAAWLARSALMQSPIGGFLKMIPRWVWLVVAGVLIALGVYLWFNAKLDAAYDRGHKDGETKAYARVTKKAQEIETKANALNRGIVNVIRSKNDEANGRSNAVADSLLVRGPGKATCPGGAGVSGLPGEHQPPAGPADAAVGRVPYPEWQQLIAMPFSPTIEFAREHDLNRNEVISCRAAWKQLSEAWPKPEGSGIKVGD